MNDIFKTLSLFIASFPLCFRHFVPFKVVHFLHSCVSTYFTIVYAAYSVYKKFLTLPFSSLFIRQGASLNFGVFCAFLVLFSTCISADFINVYAAYSVSEEIFNASFSPRFIRQGAPLHFGVFNRFCCRFNLVPTQSPNFVLGSRLVRQLQFPIKKIA